MPRPTCQFTCKGCRDVAILVEEITYLTAHDGVHEYDGLYESGDARVNHGRTFSHQRRTFVDVIMRATDNDQPSSHTYT